MNRNNKVLREYVEAFTIAIVAALVLRALFIQAFRIPTGSMKDTLLVGDFLLVNKFVYGAQTPDRIPFFDVHIPSIRFPALKAPKRGDIIVFKYPKDEKLDYIKRCVALPGDTLAIQNGVVYINDELQEYMTFCEQTLDSLERDHAVNHYKVTIPNGRQYKIRLYADGHPHYREFGPVVVPKDCLFVMGDNRDNSADSRVWGFMPIKNLVGQAFMIYWSWDKIPTSYNIFKKIRWDRIFDIIR